MMNLFGMERTRVGRHLMSASRDSALHLRLINIGHLLSGNFLSAFIALLSVGVAARALGPASYGILTLVISYTRLIERIVRFESWQPLIKYAADLTGDNDKEDLRNLYAFGLALDVSAALAAAVSAALLAVVAGALFGLKADYIGLVFIYCIALALNITGMPAAVLRLAGRFRTIAYTQILANLIRIPLCLAGLWWGGDLLYFVIVWSGAQIFGVALFFILAMLELRQQGIHNLFRARLRGIGKRFPGIMGFAWSSNLSMTLRASAQEFDVLLVGALASPAAAGLYYIAKRIAKAAQQLGAQVQTVLYPDVARLWAKNAYRAFRKAVLQVQLFLALFGICTLIALALFGHWLIRIGLGEAYMAVWPLLMVQLIAVIFTLHSAPSRSALLAMGRQHQVLQIVLAGTFVFHASALLLIPSIGAMGANIAHVLLASICAVAMDYVWLLEISRRQRARSNQPAKVG
ncbi:lipopolysaccharide biosynthesis protein [Rhizorhapis sp. SPR117]|uniref:lipopolysaccharide biosynthesis protein n=1 Tax=Rhizorhapis sp. SPR117 TaxID=2912611 RepID=UPI001F2A5448|nr:oligosaccharide flippase family protein [Rhizorhapis sp. SPR117]